MHTIKSTCCRHVLEFVVGDAFCVKLAVFVVECATFNVHSRSIDISNRMSHFTSIYARCSCSISSKQVTSIDRRLIDATIACSGGCKVVMVKNSHIILIIIIIIIISGY